MKKLLFSLLFGALALPLLVSADGAIVPPENYYAWETDQKAVIFYESAAQKETMVVAMTFSGNAKDFAWIIPVPAQPSVEKGSHGLFAALETLTGSSYYDYDYYPSSLMKGAAEDAGVSVVEQKAVDYYDVSVLSSTDSKALSKWLNDNGYKYPEKYAYIFNEYIQNGWYFVAAKIAPEVADSTAISSQLLSGAATPLQLTFATDNIVYPLKISQAISQDAALSADMPTAMGITLYVIADHRQDISGYTTNYANIIKEEKIEELAFNAQGDGWVDVQNNKYFLTKLYKYQYISQINDDVFPKNADKDTKVHSGYEWNSEKTLMLIMFSILFTAIGFAAILLSPFALIFIILTLIFYFAKSIKVKITCAVLQIIDAVITLCLFAASVALGVYYFIEMLDALEYSSYIDDEIFIACSAVAACLSFLIFFAGKLAVLLVERKKYKKIKAK